MRSSKNLLFILISILLIGCYEDFETTTIVTQQVEPGISYRHDISGIVTDTSGLFLQGATIKIQEQTVVTDQTGKFNIQSVEINEFGSFLSVEHPQYITSGIRLYPHSSLLHAIDLSLVVKPQSYSVQNNTGGQVTTESGVELNFQPESILKNNAPYSGEYQVVIFYVDPKKEQNYNKQLRAYDIENNVPNYFPKIDAISMVSITILDNNGQELQLNAEKPVRVRFPFDNTLTSQPSSVPVLSFNEENGLWQDEGNASLLNNKYEATLSHFSWWTVSNIKQTVELCFTFESILENPPNDNIYVLNTLSGNHVQAARVDYLNETCIPVPEGEDLILTVYNFCYVQNALQIITSSTVSTKQAIKVEDNTDGYIINLNIINCQANPLPGNYKITYNGSTPVEINGDFHEINLNSCFSNSTLNIVLEDLTTGALHSKIIPLDKSQNIYEENIAVCGNIPADAVLIIDGKVFENCVAHVNPEEVVVFADDGSVLLGFDYVESGPTECRLIYTTVAEEGQAIITQIGAVGEFVTGTFEAKEIGSSELIKGSFKALRKK